MSYLYAFILFMGFLWQEYLSGLPFSPLVDHILSTLPTMTCPSWVALHGVTHGFIELCKSLHHGKTVIYKAEYPQDPQLKIMHSDI